MVSLPQYASTGSNGSKHLKVILVLDIIKLKDHLDIDPYPMGPGRPRLDATAMARAFVEKSVLNIPTTRALIDRLNVDAVLRRICGFERKTHVPCEASFSNWFARFARTSFPDKVHEALVSEAHRDVPVLALPVWPFTRACVRATTASADFSWRNERHR